MSSTERRIFHIGGLNLQPGRRRNNDQRPRHQGRVQTLIDPRGLTPRIALDHGNPLWVQEGAASHTHYRYDEAGRLLERIDARGHTTRYAYDNARRLIQVTHPDGATLHLAYDEAGQLHQRVLPNGDTSLFLSVAGRLEAVEFNAGDAIRFTYDQSGRLASVTEPGCVTTCGYGAQGRLQRVERTIDQMQFRYDYDATGQLCALHLPNHTTIELSALPTPHPAPVVIGEPVRDANGNVMACDGSEFCYDDPEALWARLLEARHPQYGRTRYQYDPAGNRTARLRPDGMTCYTYDNRSRLTRIVHPDGSITHLEYNANGNLIRKLHDQTTWRYTYNGRQQLVRIDRNGQLVARYRYDFQGRRIWRQVGETIVLYHYDETNRLIALTHPDGAPVVVFTQSRRQTVAHCFQAGSIVQSCSLHVDHLGSTRQITNSTGEIVWQGEYTPFGRLRGAPPAFPCPLFAGQLWDAESGFYYCISRYYDPAVGRFITPDPWTHGPDDPRLVGQHEAGPTPVLWLTRPGLTHPYVYCLNNPLTHRDPAGLSVGLTILRTILAIFWSIPWTIFGFALALVDALLQFAILGALYLPRFALDRTSSGRIDSAALLKIGGLFNFQFAWANVIFAQRGDFDALDDTKQQHIIPTEAHRTPRQLRTEKRAYFDYLLRHTVLANYFGPIWPPVYLFGGFIPFRKDAVRESGYSPIDDPVLTIAPEKVYSRTDSFLIAIGGKKPYTVQLSDATAGALTPFVDQPAFSEARFQPQYVPGEHTITLRDANNADDTREIKIVEIEVDDIELRAPTHLLVDKLSNPPRPVLRLVNREAGTVEFKIDPDEGATFFEVFEPDPNDPAARALDLSRTNGTGDTQVTITPHSRPGPIGRFMELDPAFQATLDLGVISPDLRQQLQANGVRLSLGPTLVVRNAGLSWQVLDGVQNYVIRRVDPFVYNARGYRLFTLFSLFIPDLNNNNLTAELRGVFEAQRVALAPAAVLSTQQAGSQWRIVDGAQTYTIRGQHRLSVFEQFANNSPLEYTVRIKSWDDNGIVLKTMQVRSLGMINVTLQAHIVRDDSGNRPAADDALLDRLRRRINEVWRQAGIQFFWRAERQFIDEEDFLVIRVGHPTLPSEYPDMFRWRPTPPGPWPVAAHTDHNDQDKNAIHVYFINDLDQPAGGKKILAFVPFLGNNAVVMPKIADADDLAHELGHTLGLPHPDEILPASPEADKRVMFSLSADFPGQRFLIANHEPAREGPGRLAPGDPSSDETRHARGAATSHMGP